MDSLIEQLRAGDFSGKPAVKPRSQRKPSPTHRRESREKRENFIRSHPGLSINEMILKLRTAGMYSCNTVNIDIERVIKRVRT